MPWSKGETLLRFSHSDFFSCVQFWACSRISGFKDALALPIVIGLCHLHMLQIYLKRIVLVEVDFSIMPHRVLAATPLAHSNEYRGHSFS